MGDLSPSWLAPGVVLIGTCALTTVLLLFTVMLLASARRRLGYLEAYLADIAADLRTISLRLALEDPSQKHMTSQDPVPPTKPEVTPIMSPGGGDMSARIETHRRPPVSVAASESRRDAYIPVGIKPDVAPEQKSRPRTTDYADDPPSVSAVDLMRPTHFEPPFEEGVHASAPKPMEAPLTPEEEADIWRLRAVRRSIEESGRPATQDGAKVSHPRTEPTLRWPPKPS